MDDEKRRWAAAHDRSAARYDHPVRRFFDLNAEALVRRAEVPVGARVLDVATGTGKVALAAAQAVGPGGRVVGIDISQGMLEQARHKSRGLPIDYLQMDAETLEFEDAAFDVVLCGFGVFFLPDPTRGMREMHRVLRRGGRGAISTFTPETLQPMLGMFRARVARYGIATMPEPWSTLTAPEHVEAMLESGGFSRQQVIRETLGYALKDAEEWWTFLRNGTWRGVWDQLSAEALEQFHRETIDEVGRLRTDRGIWLNASSLIGIGSKDAA